VTEPVRSPAFADALAHLEFERAAVQGALARLDGTRAAPSDGHVH
jgi:hypothetical protein